MARDSFRVNQSAFLRPHHQSLRHPYLKAKSRLPSGNFQFSQFEEDNSRFPTLLTGSDTDLVILLQIMRGNIRSVEIAKPRRKMLTSGSFTTGKNLLTVVFMHFAVIASLLTQTCLTGPQVHAVLLLIMITIDHNTQFSDVYKGT